VGENSPWGILQKVYRVLDIAGFNTKMWMVHFLDIDKAFIKFFTA
jgi:transposase-like protein